MTESGPSVLRGTVEYALSAASGSEYLVRIAVPDEPPPPGGFPVLYLLDGGAFFGTLVEMVRLRRNRPAMTATEAAIVVGIGHPGAHPYDSSRRQAEFTPGPHGSAEAFLRFVSAELLGHMEERFEANPDRRVLMGHSLAGSFVLHALCERPMAFHGYVAISPSIWAYAEILDQGLRGVSDRLEGADDPRRVLIAVAQYDQELAPWQRAAPKQTELLARREARAMVDVARQWSAELAAAAEGRADVRFDVCPGEDHATVLPVALSRSLRFVIGIER